ncbi:MAG: NAD(P)/FAD-dependent oxidoreductase [Spirochaetaceae bacterium]|nr:NAD(P)/FAD-dependent oxidoreductase [Spirochaetaceae bacterium]
MSKVIIIGGGVSGLSAGIYAARSGFETEIIEQHRICGGFSTGWTRKGYYFEGGMHWLTGSADKLPLNRIWKETGALQENNPIENRDPVYTLVDGDKRLNLYRDLNKLKNELLEYAPEDSKMIKRMCRDIKYFQKVHFIVNDIRGLKSQYKNHPSLFELLSMAPAGLRYFQLLNTNYKDYVAKFKNPKVRQLLMTVIGNRYNSVSFIYTMAAFSAGDSGYPEGGSIRMVDNMVNQFSSLGGKIRFNTKVQQIVIKDNRVTGVQTEKEFIPCDHLILSSDARKAIDSLFSEPLKTPETEFMRKRLQTEADGSQNIFVSIGVKSDYSNLPHSMVFPLPEPLEYAGNSFDAIRINNYSMYKNHAPSGGSSLTCLLICACYDFWKKAKDDGTYKEKKTEFANLFLDKISPFLPDLKENLEVIDVATPITYERYCDSWKGTWMTIWKRGKKSPKFPQKLKEIKNLYFAGHRIMMCGGLPVAVYTGRRAVQLLCKDTGTVFV